MADIHYLIRLHGRDAAKDMIEESDRYLVDIAARIMETESTALGITYSGFCMTSLPHRMIPAEQNWERSGEHVTLVIYPGSLRINGVEQKFGVPYGSRARMILLYLQTRAMQLKSPEVDLGPSLNAWMTRMRVPLGGKSRLLIKEQANRLAACNLTFYYERDRRRGFERDHIIKGAFSFTDDMLEGSQSRLWEDRIRLGETFYRALTEHPVPLLEAALSEISNKSMALDLYCWLAYRLRSLTRDTPVSWYALYKQFGSGFNNLRNFKAHFIEALKAALAVYPEAQVRLDQKEVILCPSRPPIGETKIYPVRALLAPSA